MSKGTFRESSLIGKKVYIPDWDGKYSGDWGRIVACDGEYYHVEYADDKDSVLVFNRDEIRVCRHQDN